MFCSKKKFLPDGPPGNPPGGDVVFTSMKTNRHILIPAMAALAFAWQGCVGTGPNTQRGAIGGAVLGSIAGAVIGNNSGHGNGARGAVIGGAAGSIAGGTMGNAVDHERGTIYTSERSATTDVYVSAAPPPPPRRREVVVVERPYREAVWVDGYWAYIGRGEYAWVEGRWMRPPGPYRTYVAPHWKRQRGGYVYVEGYWGG
jgi:hypothetical protein